MAGRWGIILLCLAVLLGLFCGAFGEIHRAKALKRKQPKNRLDPHTDYSVWPPGYSEDRHVQYPKLATQSRKNIEEKNSHKPETWLYSMLSAMLVGLSGIFPLMVIPLEAGKALRHGAAAEKLKLLLSFAVGGLLGDVFLHLLPEAWASIDPLNVQEEHKRIGLWVLGGIFSFLILEKAFPDNDEDEEEEEEEEEEIEEEPAIEEFSKEELLFALKNALSDKEQAINLWKKGEDETDPENDHALDENNPDPPSRKENGDVKQKTSKDLKNSIIQAKKDSSTNGRISPKIRVSDKKQKHRPEKADKATEDAPQIKTIGWLNLMANVIDNFTHGLAVAGSYCISTKTGMITTFAILLHEVPHEIGDFAILLRAGFDRWKAAKAQLVTATGGLLGAITALSAESAEIAGNKTAWVLPFTAGGFIYISLVTVVPDLVKERNPWNSLKQVVLLLTGMAIMAGVTAIFE